MSSSSATLPYVLIPENWDMSIHRGWPFQLLNRNLFPIDGLFHLFSPFEMLLLQVQVVGWPIMMSIWC